MSKIFHLYGPGHVVDAVPTDLPEEIRTARGVLKLHRQQFDEGPSAGVELLQISGERVGFALLPTRGMGLWRAWAGDFPFGWRSPVHGPIHPSLVPLSEPSGLGWLAGFDELLVRCGLQSNGAPDFDADGRLRYPLHGRVANLPAESLTVAVNADSGTIEVTGVVREARLFFYNLTLTSTVRMKVDGDTIEIEDRVMNHSDAPGGHQMLYHINLGRPLLGKGAELIVAPEEVVPKTAHAATDVDRFERYDRPRVGFAEQVYLMRLASDASGWTHALLRSADGDAGFGVSFDTSTLPYFVQWKNTAGEADGYVTGMEPATGFPNTRSYEEANGRVVTLGPGQSVAHRLQLHLLRGTARVDALAEKIRQLAPAKSKIESKPRTGWCEGY